MTELIERYVHQVGLYLPLKERAEIEAELRSQIQDQLDDRYAGSPTEAEVAAVLTHLGAPRQIAASYGSQQYLVGPDLYPFMLMILRHGWLIVPLIVAFLRIFGALTSLETTTLPDLLLGTLVAILQATFVFSGVVVLIFAIIQHSGMEPDEALMKFDPLSLPEVDDPSVVDRLEATFGIAFGLVVTLILLYFAQVGGLTLRFNLSDPGEVIPVPAAWLILLIVTGFANIVLHVLVLRRNRWNAGLWLTETLLEVFGVVCMYFAIFTPVFAHVIVDNPNLADVPLPEIMVMIFAISTLVVRGIKFVQLWNYRSTPSRTRTGANS